MKKVLYITLGCKVNQYETQGLRELLASKGYQTAKAGEEPDILLLNSCTVTAESDRKTRQTLRHYKRKYPRLLSVLIGCMPSAFPKKAEALLQADIVFGNTDHAKIPELIEEYYKAPRRMLAIEEHKKGEEYKTPSISAFEERTRAYMKIEDGCDRFCSYCAIPYARGRVRSRTLQSIKAEAEALSKNGYKEIVLVGINLSSFGKGEAYDLAAAVSVVAEVEGIKRVRLGSLEPDHLSREMLEAFKKIDKFCPQFHLSLQSGCDETLKRMNRHYDTAFYAELVDRIRDIFPLAAITTDIMVGFQGETEEEFKASLGFLKKIGFARCHIFSYSLREGTAAARLPQRVENGIKAQRSAEMITLAEQTRQAFLENMIGKRDTVLFESYKDGYLEGYTPNYTRVRAKGDESLAGELCSLELEGLQGDVMIGRIIGEEV